jgi:drug/metabolite transporter (DMT)-like permease
MELETKTHKGKAKQYLLLYFLIFLYSIYALLCKFASANPFLSFPFLLLYGGALLVMLLYALLWQKVLKHLPLNVAISNKAVVVIWGMIWGAIFFSESISVPKIIGAVMVMIGIFLVVQDEK